MATRTINTQRLGRIHDSNAINYNMGNWGLIRHTNNSNPFTSVADFDSSTLQSFTYTYDDNHGQGENVDIIFILSGMIWTDNPGYQNSDGTSRIQQFQWNTLNNLPNMLTDITSVIARVTSFVSPSTGQDWINEVVINVGTNHGLSVGDTVTLSGLPTAPFSIGSDVYLPEGVPDLNGTHTVYALGDNFGNSAASSFRIYYNFPEGTPTSSIAGTPNNQLVYYDRTEKFPVKAKYGATFDRTINYSTSASRSTHSELVVKCACDNDYGAASKSNIYIIPRSQVNDDPGVYWTLPKLFHQEKKQSPDPLVNGRPTLVINSFGDNEYFDNIKYIDFRGTRHRTLNGGRSLGSATGSGQNSSYETGFHNHNQYRHYRAADTALINEMTAAGVHHVVSAGNAKHKLDVSGGIDYNNALRKVDDDMPFDSYYNRATYDTDDSIVVGNLNSWFNDGNQTVSDVVPFKEVCPYEGEFTNPTSNRGPRVDCYVAGTNIVTTIPNTNNHTLTNGVVQNGTSFSCPILGGLAALVLSKYPTTTPRQLRVYFRYFARSSDGINDKAVDPKIVTDDTGDPQYMYHNNSQNSNPVITYVDPSLSLDPTNLFSNIGYPLEVYQPVYEATITIPTNPVSRDPVPRRSAYTINTSSGVFQGEVQFKKSETRSETKREIS